MPPSTGCPEFWGHIRCSVGLYCKNEFRFKKNMKYFVDKAYTIKDGSTRFYEFQKGKIDYENDKNPHWKDDSLYMGDEVVWELQLDTLFAETLENYDFMGDNFVNRQQWERIAACAQKAGGKWQEAMEELTPWVNDTFTTHDCFTIIGM